MFLNKTVLFKHLTRANICALPSLLLWRLHDHIPILLPLYSAFISALLKLRLKNNTLTQNYHSMLSLEIISNSIALSQLFDGCLKSLSTVCRPTAQSIPTVLEYRLETYMNSINRITSQTKFLYSWEIPIQESTFGFLGYNTHIQCVNRDERKSEPMVRT